MAVNMWIATSLAHVIAAPSPGSMAVNLTSQHYPDSLGPLVGWHPPNGDVFLTRYERATGTSAGSFDQSQAQKLALDYALALVLIPLEETFPARAFRNPTRTLELYITGLPNQSRCVVKFALWGIFWALFMTSLHHRDAFGKYCFVYQRNTEVGYLQFRAPTNVPTLEAAPPLAATTAPDDDANALSFRSQYDIWHEITSHKYYFPLLTFVEEAGQEGLDRDFHHFEFNGYGTEGIKCEILDEGRLAHTTYRTVLKLVEEMARLPTSVTQNRYVKTSTIMSLNGRDLAVCHLCVYFEMRNGTVGDAYQVDTF